MYICTHTHAHAHTRARTYTHTLSLTLSILQRIEDKERDFEEKKALNDGRRKEVEERVGELWATYSGDHK